MTQKGSRNPGLSVIEAKRKRKASDVTGEMIILVFPPRFLLQEVYFIKIINFAISGVFVKKRKKSPPNTFSPFLRDISRFA